MSITLEFVKEFGDEEPLDSGAVDRNFRKLQGAVNPPMPQARVSNGSDISTTSGVDKVLSFNTERWDNGKVHDTSVAERLRAPMAGLYAIGAHVMFTSNATGYRQVVLRLNGTTNIAADTRPAANGQDTNVTVTTQYELAQGDYVEVLARQTSGGALNVRAVGNLSPEFWMTRLGGFVNQGVA